MGRLTVFSNRNLAPDKVYAVPKERLVSRDALTYVFQGTIHPKGLLTHGILREPGQNIVDNEIFATAIRKSELEKLAYVSRLRRNEGRVPVTTFSTKPSISPNDSEDEQALVAACESALVPAGSYKRTRSDMQGLLITSPLCPVPAAPAKDYPDCTDPDPEVSPDMLVLQTLHQVYFDHKLLITKKYRLLQEVQCPALTACTVVEVRFHLI